MLTVRIVPCLDVRDGRVVKGIRFQGLRDAGDPAELAARYEQEGADELVVLDVAATPRQRSHQVATVRAVRSALSIPLTVGGGVRHVADAGRLLEAGADKVAVNTAAVRDPGLVRDLAGRFGSQCTVVAIDARRLGAASDARYEALVRSGAESAGRDAVAWAREVEQLGAGEILLTSWDRDGTRQGYDIDLLRLVGAAVTVPVIASGGADSAGHMLAAVRAGADAVLAASIFHYREHTIGGVKAELARAGVPVRPEVLA